MVANEQTLLRIPSILRAKIVSEADKLGISIQAVIIERLSKSYRIKSDLPKKGWIKGRSRVLTKKAQFDEQSSTLKCEAEE